jgi:DNA-binding XRE family transcriptional regulator
MSCPCLGLRLRQFRLTRKLTQATVAHQVGCSRVAITQFEAGTSTPSLDLLVRLKVVLHAPSLDALVAPCPCHLAPQDYPV